MPKSLVRSATVRISLALVVICLAATIHVIATAQTTRVVDWTAVEDHWYILEMGGSKIGWEHSFVESDGGLFRTTSETQMSMERGAASVHVKTRSVFLETADGTPVSVESVQNLASQAVHMTWTFEGDKVTQVSEEGGRSVTKELERPKGQWLTPQAIDRLTKEKLKSGAGTISFHTLSPEMGLKVISSSSTCAGEDTLEVNGTKVAVTVWKTRSDAMPGMESTDKIDGDGIVVYQETPFGLGKIVRRVATRQQATDKAKGGAPEILGASFVRPDKPIARPRETSRTRLKLTIRKGALPEMPSAGAQRVEMSSDGKSAILTIDVDQRIPASDDDLKSKDYLADSTMTNINDDLVQTLAKKGVKGAGDDAMTRAGALRKLAHTHVSKKGMATAFATASETARTRTGDCSEHGVLLCALLRANGIPARVACGLIYADSFAGEHDIFGWHMWTQALIDGRWVDFDPTLPQRTDATHILTNTASLADGLGMSDLASMMQLMGNLDVQVLEVRHESADTTADAVHE